MRREVRKYLYDILTAGNEIISFTAEKTLQHFHDDRLLHLGVEREFEIIGEALRRALELDVSLEDHITDLQQIIGFRNRLIHGYDDIDDAVVWTAIHRDLPRLLEEVERLLA